MKRIAIISMNSMGTAVTKSRCTLHASEIPAAGHRIGTAEVENTLTDHSACSEAAVIG